MPRPLIIKIENSNATSPIRTAHRTQLVVRSRSESHSAMVQSNGMVRSLISLYEFPDEGPAYMTKAKSLQNLGDPEPSVRRSAHIEMPGMKTFDFRRVWSKFETHNKRETVTNTVKTSHSGIQQRAEQLLQQYRGVEDRLWSERVVDLLRDICNKCDRGSSEEVVEESSTTVNSKSQKVRDIASLYERKIGNGPTTVKPNFAKYFTSATNPTDATSLPSEGSESDLSEYSELNSSSVNITELRSHFEPSNGEREVVRLLPPPKISLLEDDQKEDSMQRIAALIDNIEKQQQRIAALSKEDYEEGPKINEELIQALIKLDEVPTLGDVTLQAERKKAILLVQASIRQLMDKRRSS
ncbi:uncharacterized protein LOC116178729 [Photinus pyralis]|uniref:uncharacterized protein LOC116178729 n=1 Tax=Photinus pyralis TaxID=7054 RepID=UPI00126736F6|nr:uncharacterized protein LOC116178729 [Photinus pyralis]